MTNHPHPTEDRGRPRPPLSRRQFLSMAGVGIALGATGMTGQRSLAGAQGQALERLNQVTQGVDAAYATGPNDPGLILVTIQLGGGLDFLDTVVPIGSGRYRDLRRGAAIEASQTSPIDDDYGLYRLPYLAEQWHAGNLGIVHGVGHPKASLSHFTETDLWERGSIDPDERTGWLGRSLNALGGSESDALIGVGIGQLSPSLYAPGWNPVAIPADGRLPWDRRFIEENPTLVRAYTDLVTARSSGSMGGGRSGSVPLAAQVRASQRLVREVAGELDHAADLGGLAERLEQLHAEEELHADGDGPERSTGMIGHGLTMVADLINGGLPTRAYHLLHEGFDTHANQTAELPVLLDQLDGALRQFDRTLGANRNKVIVATWTEFGRRPEANGSGTDHGTAGTQFVLGPSVRGGHLGEPVDLGRLDDDGNVAVTTDFGDYLSGLSRAAFGLESDRIVAGATPMELRS